VAIGLAIALSASLLARVDLPVRLTDQAFWQLSESLSEPSGSFQSDNLVSNETGMQKIIPELVDRVGTGGVYLGVGPEQNYTYIAALQPRIAFILDVRRGNRDMHLMYKAIFELSADRVEFVSRLFSRARPSGLTRESTATEIFSAIEFAPPSEQVYLETILGIRDVLITKHGLPLSEEELDNLNYIFTSFYRFGPAISYSSSRSGRAATHAQYSSLMQLTDAAGIQRSYLSSDERFQTVKALHAANLIVPVIGNFAGPKALRAIGAWLRERQETVSVYYLSNVEDYLPAQTLWPTFCRNVASLPLTERSTFIRTGRGPSLSPASAVSGAQWVIIPGPVGGATTQPRPVVPIVSSGGMATSKLAYMTLDIKACGS
jgi:hypothetical protein